MTLLEALKPTIQGFDRVWITSEGVYAEELRRSGETVRTLPRLDRSAFSISAARRSAELALRERPQIILTSGAGLVVPFCVVGRAMGASIVFVETMARVRTPSTSARAVSRLGAHMFVQWEELGASFERVVVCRPLLLEGIGSVAPTAGEGTFVTLGSHDQPFRWLTRLVKVATEAGVLPRPIVLQDGTRTNAPDWADVHHQYVSPDSFRSLVVGSAVVVAHAGAGAMASSLQLGHRPVVVPRQKSLGEHVDDHQLDLADKLESLGYIERGDRGISLELVNRVRAPASAVHASAVGLPMEEAVSSALQTIVERRAHRRSHVRRFPG